MADLVLVRGAFTATATFGMLAVEGGAAFAVTVEREWDHNRKSTPTRPGACIPAGTYRCRRVISPKFGETFEIEGVPNRDKILIHCGNLSSDSHGCVIIGDTFDPVNGEDGVTQSRDAFAELMRLQAGVTTFMLEIIDAVPHS
jgi:hypothetical protein